MSGQQLVRISIALCLLALGSGCAELETAQQAAANTIQSIVPSHLDDGYWNDDGGASGPAKIVVSISKQRAYFLKGKTVVGETTVSTGKAGFSTPPGQYRVVWKHKDHISSVFGDYVDGAGNVTKSNVDSRKDRKPPGSHFDGARMPYAMFFRGGYAMHQGYVPPYAASHGCIRLPEGMAERFFNAAEYGTPVVVKQ
jgi:lipoprotein-anchoring transpeptidase ErfK/SrfK